MLKITSYWTVCLMILGGFLLTSCGEDRTYEYYALIRPKTWIYETMQQYYLFYEDLPSEDRLNFFNKPQDFLESVVSASDKKSGVTFSHIDSVQTASRTTMSSVPNFGIEGAMVQVSSGAYAIRVLYTQPNSPAEEAGLKRGDWIISVNGYRMRSTDYSTYISNPSQACNFTLGQYNGTTFDTIPGQVQMPEPRYVEIHHLLKKSILEIGGKKVAYLLYNEFGEGDETELDQWFAEVASQQPDAMVLDLRYNPGGYLNIAQKLGSMLAPQSAQGQTFVRMIHNDKINNEEVLNVESALIPGGSPLNYTNLYVLTTSNTASASEVIINCLRPYMQGRLYQVGSATFGKNIGQQLFTNEEDAPQLEFWLSTVYLSNSEGHYDYYSGGLSPDYELSEDLGGALGEFATEADSLIQPVFMHIETGSFTTPTEEDDTADTEEGDGEEAEEETAGEGIALSRSGSPVTVVYHSIAAKPHWAKKSK